MGVALSVADSRRAMLNGIFREAKRRNVSEIDDGIRIEKSSTPSVSPLPGHASVARLGEKMLRTCSFLFLPRRSGEVRRGLKSVSLTFCDCINLDGEVKSRRSARNEVSTPSVLPQTLGEKKSLFLPRRSGEVRRGLRSDPTVFDGPSFSLTTSVFENAKTNIGFYSD